MCAAKMDEGITVRERTVGGKLGFYHFPNVVYLNNE
jgi:hypothetical protein